MKYMMMCFEDAADFEARSDQAKAPAYWGQWSAYVEALQKAGVLVNGNGLQQPHTATTMKMLAGKRQVQDGPMADTKEQLGGYFIIEVADLDAALEWASRSPSASTAGVEVRPVLPPMQ